MQASKSVLKRASEYTKNPSSISSLSKYNLMNELSYFGVEITNRADLDNESLKAILRIIINRIQSKYSDDIDKL
jgi:hypothetical protein